MTTQPLFTDFFYLLRNYGVPVSMRDVLDLYRGMEKGIVDTLDEFFVFARLTFVRRVEHMDAFERAFALYFYGIDIPRVGKDDRELLNTKQFKEWLAEAVQRGELPKTALWTMDAEELMKRFWDTVREQTEAHHGGNRWVGTGGNSPFGHSGNAKRGVRVGGGSGAKSAIKVINDRRYVDYSETNTLSDANIHQALDAMKNMKKHGAPHVLNLDETIRVTSKSGDIDLIFDRELRDKISVVLMVDNGGTSMMPYVHLTRLLFARLNDRFKDITTYYFHNTIYGTIWSDPPRRKPITVEKILQRNQDTRVVIIGDASMAPEELAYGGGAISLDADDSLASLHWLRQINERFEYACWLNPIAREEWESTYGRQTVGMIREVFHMEDMTLRGIKGMVGHLTRHKYEY
jgi:hypothetical protein